MSEYVSDKELEEAIANSCGRCVPCRLVVLFYKLRKASRDHKFLCEHVGELEDLIDQMLDGDDDDDDEIGIPAGNA